MGVSPRTGDAHKRLCYKDLGAFLQFCPNAPILTDTYPHPEDHKRTLILYRPGDDLRVDVGRFHSPPELQGEIRCDLHPRWSRDGTKVCFDSMHEGSRQVYVMDVSEVVG